MVFEIPIGKIVASKLFGYGLDAARSLFQLPRMIEAFEKSCLAVVKEESHFFDKPTIQAISSSAGLPDEERLWFKLEQSFAVSNFPDIQQLTEMLIICWKARKNQLDSTEAAQFFCLSEDQVRPIIQKISERFFTELAQVPEVNIRVNSSDFKLSRWIGSSC